MEAREMLNGSAGVTTHRLRRKVGRQRAPDYSPDELQAIREGVAAGKTTEEIAKQIGRSSQGVYEKARQLGLGRTKRRFTPEEDRELAALYLAYAPLDDIAVRLNRDTGTLRQRVLRLGLRRSGVASRYANGAPTALLEILGQDGADTFNEAMRAYRAAQDSLIRDLVDKQRQQTAEAVKAALQKHLVSDMPRDAAIMFKRGLGMTLEEIGQQHGLTRERVRQILMAVARRRDPTDTNQV